MGRRGRNEEPGAVHHVVPQGNGRSAIVLDDRDRRAYVNRFNRVAHASGWTVHASSLLDTHHHAVLETPVANLGQGMRLVIGGHAAWLNRRHNRAGAVFGDRYWSTRVYDAAHLLRACLYTLLNPVAAGLVRHPQEWQWSSYRSLVVEGCTPRLCNALGERPDDATTMFLELVDRAVDLITVRRVCNRGGVVDVTREIASSVARPMPTAGRQGRG